MTQPVRKAQARPIARSAYLPPTLERVGQWSWRTGSPCNPELVCSGNFTPFDLMRLEKELK